MNEEQIIKQHIEQYINDSNSLMNKENFKKQYMGEFKPDNSYKGIYDRIRFVPKEEIAGEIAGHLEAQYFLDQRIENLQVECDSHLKQIAYYQDQVNTLTHHIQNLKKMKQDYCMCGSHMDTHVGSCDHAPIIEFDWYIKENGL